MCGVCGVIRASGTGTADRSLVTTVNARQHHRGPDDAVQWYGEQAVLGQTRLAVIDLSEGGRQPFVSADASVVVVFNGEIYNHDELRRRYRLAVADRCDGAVLPELWQRLGTAMFAQLRGMYAIAVHDVRARTVTLARDPFGVKPLYWTRTTDGAIAFASEPRPLLPLVPRPRLDPEGVHNYLMYGAVGRDRSPFREITSVPANGWVQWDAATTRTDGTVSAGLLEALPPASLQQLRDEFVRSVSLHLVSDVPVALLLSSGLDSAALAWACAELGTDLTCVTVDLGGGVSEAAGAGRVAARFGHRHEIVSTSPDTSIVERFFAAMQKPSIDGLNTFLVSRAIASLGVKVALSGLGGDELLGGYQSFRALRYLPLLRAADTVSLTSLLAKLYGRRNHKAAHLLGANGPRDAAGLGDLYRRVFLDDQVGALVPWAPRGEAAPPSSDTSAQTLSRVELTSYLGGTLLPDTDAHSMTWSVEMRVPFVDVPFARTALAVAPRRGVGKRRFAEAVGDPELRAITRRKKQGFTLPMDDWMRTGPLASWVQAARSPDAPVRALLRGDAVDRVLHGWDGGHLRWSRAWSIVALDGWLRSVGMDVAEIELPVATAYRKRIALD
ncbi:asparagine synthase (glutamine-hydrolyzing) [Planosporangium mesophilum]|uniref:asparagine synthase (glutamine-hydrolyzing) n=1 Tax=Planosporangium mesophilum TaxID=689768 RepID=A0A8J3T9Q7_9ACTN|nr:asparagine synthase (glutamine-hydrolyzing) [Planosporangium mesophilum]NJC81142.1 asparagine synthase (glutamine-hydrolyzing) [Planosporangium mesophilum]GII21207.1 asparagine synthetase B [Planosporangium mesophilum]